MKECLAGECGTFHDVQSLQLLNMRNADMPQTMLVLQIAYLERISKGFAFQSVTATLLHCYVDRIIAVKTENSSDSESITFSDKCYLIIVSGIS